MTNKSKAKGYRFEKQLVDILNSEGIEARRGWGSDGRSLGFSSGVDVVAKGWNIQIKGRRKLPQWLTLPKDCDTIAFREDRGKWHFLISLEDFIKMVKMEE